MTDQTTTQLEVADNSTSGNATTTEQTNATQQTTQTEATTTSATTTADSTTTKAWHEDQAILDYANKRATVDGKLDQKLADKTLARLKRFPSLNEALDWAFNSDKKIADGSYKKPPGEKATPEELTAYRELNGIPETPEGYLEKLPDGLVIGDEDKPIVDHFLKAFHAKHTDPAVVSSAIKAYYDMVDETEGARQQANVAAKAAVDDEMKAEWGPEYPQNVGMVNAMLEGMPKEAQEELLQSTMPDGSQILNSPNFMRWMAETAKALNLTGSVAPSGQADAVGIEQEMADLAKASGDKYGPYWKGPAHPTRKGETIMSARHLELIEQKERLAKRK